MRCHTCAIEKVIRPLFTDWVTFNLTMIGTAAVPHWRKYIQTQNIHTIANCTYTINTNSCKNNKLYKNHKRDIVSFNSDGKLFHIIVPWCLACFWVRDKWVLVGLWWSSDFIQVQFPNTIGGTNIIPLTACYTVHVSSSLGNLLLPFYSNMIPANKLANSSNKIPRYDLYWWDSYVCVNWHNLR